MTTRTPKDYALTDDQANAIALAAFEKHCGRPHPWEGAQPWVIAAIKAAGAPQSGWISVDDELPHPFEEVIVHPRPTDYCCEASVDTKGAWRYSEYERHIGQESHACTVTHWLRVPLPPSTNGEPT